MPYKTLETKTSFIMDILSYFALTTDFTTKGIDAVMRSLVRTNLDEENTYLKVSTIEEEQKEVNLLTERLNNLCEDVSEVTKDGGIFKTSDILQKDVLESINSYPMYLRALTPHSELHSEYRVYMVMDDVTTKDGLIRPWHASPGGAIQSKLSDNSYYDNDLTYRFKDSCATLILTNSLLRIAVIEPKFIK